MMSPLLIETALAGSKKQLESVRIKRERNIRREQ
jgi:hypothetical protein